MEQIQITYTIKNTVENSVITNIHVSKPILYDMLVVISTLHLGHTSLTGYSPKQTVVSCVDCKSLVVKSLEAVSLVVPSLVIVLVATTWVVTLDGNYKNQAMMTKQLHVHMLCVYSTLYNQTFRYLNCGGFLSFSTPKLHALLLNTITKLFRANEFG